MENVLFGLFDNGQALEAQTLASDQQTQQWLVTEFDKQRNFFLSKIKEEKDFDHIEPVFFSTSNAGGKAPALAKNETALKDANDIDALKKCDIILTCQGGG